MKRTIVKFGTAALLVGMFAMMPSCKQKPVESTETVVTDSTTSMAAPTDSMSAPAATDTASGKEGVKQPG